MIVIVSSVYHVVNLLVATIGDFAMSKCIVNGIHTEEDLQLRKTVILYEDFFQNLRILEAHYLGRRYGNKLLSATKEIFPDSKIAATLPGGPSAQIFSGSL